jgi:hypothetical protein
MLRTLATVAFVAGAALAAPDVRTDLHSDMVALDRAYVPALALTNQPKPEPAQKAIARLRAEWNRFKAAHAPAPPAFEAIAWAKRLREVEGAVAAAEVNVAAGKGPAAHEDLERVREGQFAVRRGAGMAYFLDDLTMYHVAMEKLASPATAKTAATLTDADIAAIRVAPPEAERSWRAVVDIRGQVARHGLAADAEQAVQRDIDAQTQLLAEVGAALSAGDRGRVADKAMATKPAFSRMFQRFGDFSGLR